MRGEAGREEQRIGGRFIWDPGWSCCRGGFVVFKMERGSTFVINAALNCMDVRGAGSQASCYGVNLACAGFGVGVDIFQL